MHELSLCQSVIETLQRESLQHHYQRVKRVRLEIGPFATVDEEALRFAFEVARSETLAEGAELEIIRSEARARCRSCSNSFAITERFDPCPLCASHELELLSGEELRIVDLQVE
ncbi:MAG: hydrogenase maturation nickel metallochaperone HypA [Chromatiales bacterium]|nr:hydrogenase maturation nickel metallochaperone HypA [Chromatiales bacterium]